MMQAGACTYLSKMSAASDLVKTIRAAYAKDLMPTPVRAPSVTVPVSKPSARHRAPMGGANLTKSQLAVLKLLIQGYSDNKIAQRLMLSEERVQSHLSYIFAALGVTSRKEVVVAATTSDRLLFSEARLFTFPGIELDEDRHEVIVRGRLANLSPTEYEVLYHLMSLPDQPVSKQELLCQIWHSDFERSTNLVEVTIRRLREKIEEEPARPIHVVTVQRVGYKFNTQSEIYHVNASSASHQYREAAISE
jgi:DNA-binding winged helix-turn-helix (wHTH) protein/DNA-binding CsgD family transcriptional regulator